MLLNLHKGQDIRSVALSSLDSFYRISHAILEVISVPNQIDTLFFRGGDRKQVSVWVSLAWHSIVEFRDDLCVQENDILLYAGVPLVIPDNKFCAEFESMSRCYFEVTLLSIRCLNQVYDGFVAFAFLFVL